MPNVLGRYENGHAYVDFTLRGTKPQEIACAGLIDTGFTGFVQLPMQHAIALGLPLHGTISSTLADGRRVDSYTAVAIAELTGFRRPGIVTLSTSANDILVGMEFLRTFGFGLYLTSEAVLLFQHPSSAP